MCPISKGKKQASLQTGLEQTSLGQATLESSSLQTSLPLNSVLHKNSDPSKTQLTDPFQRHLTYVRLSVTDVCNFRCKYCLPLGYKKPPIQRNPLTLEEIGGFTRAFQSLGIQKIRLTGGEPLVRQDIVSIVSHIKKLGMPTVALTTNAYRLYDIVDDLVKAGLDAINISLDTLNARNFYDLTGQPKFPIVMRGIKKALQYQIPVKINVVLLKGFNDHIGDFIDWMRSMPLTLRFIELMPTNQKYFKAYYKSSKAMEKKLLQEGWSCIVKKDSSGPAREYSHPKYKGKLGFITPLQHHFCTSCNRLRITAYGELMPCLFGNIKIDLRSLCSDSTLLQQRIKYIVEQKPKHHYLDQGIINYTKNLSSIGG